MTTSLALLWVVRLSAVGTALASLEYLVHRRSLRDDGLMSWPVNQLRQPWLLVGPVGRVLDATLAYPRVLGLLGVRSVLAGVMVFGPAAVVLSPWLLWPAVACTGLLLLRSAYGQDGSDQMGWILLAAVALMSLYPTPRVQAVCLAFVALQSCLAYFQAGWAKLGAPGWRDGTYLLGILRLDAYGHPGLARLLDGRPRVLRVLSLSVVLWELLFVLVLVVPLPWAYAILAGGVLFHSVNAVVMGLNGFFWQFVAPYPAIVWCLQVRGW